jgi:predicted RNase H-like HicB family nuclease
MIAINTHRIRAKGEEGAGAPDAQPCDLLRQVILIRGEGGCWIAECPSLPGCTGEGASRAAAIASVRQAIANHLAELLACDLPVPEERFDALILAV